MKCCVEKLSKFVLVCVSFCVIFAVQWMCVMLCSSKKLLFFPFSFRHCIRLLPPLSSSFRSSAKLCFAVALWLCCLLVLNFAEPNGFLHCDGNDEDDDYTQTNTTRSRLKIYQEYHPHFGFSFYSIECQILIWK